jgi:hypothetical protein
MQDLWIKCSEGMPTGNYQEEKFLVWNIGKINSGKNYHQRPLIAYFHDGNFWLSPSNPLMKATHWMKIEPPKSPEKSEYPFVPIEMGGRTFHTHNIEAFHPDKI